MTHNGNHWQLPPDRQRGVLDSHLLASASVFAIGAGRSLNALKGLAAAKVRRFDLVDPQCIDEGNLGQSGVTRRDIGRAKVRVAAEHIVDTNPDAVVRCWECRAEDVPDLRERMCRSDVLKVGIDDPEAMFWLSDLGQRVGTDTFVAGTSGDCSQHFVALLEKNGAPLRSLIPDAWAGVQAGYRPPPFFPSAQVFSDALNVKAVLAILGVLHHRAGSDLEIAKTGEALMRRPLIIGSNSVHGDFFNPSRMFGPDDLQGA